MTVFLPSLLRKYRKLVLQDGHVMLAVRTFGVGSKSSWSPWNKRRWRRALVGGWGGGVGKDLTGPPSITMRCVGIGAGGGVGCSLVFFPKSEKRTKLTI